MCAMKSGILGCLTNLLQNNMHLVSMSVRVSYEFRSIDTRMILALSLLYQKIYAHPSFCSVPASDASAQGNMCSLS